MPKPHICQVLHSLECGGAERLALRLGEKLAEKAGVSLCLLDTEGPLVKAAQERAIPVDVIGRRPGLDISCARKLRKRWKLNLPSVVVAHQYTPFVYAALARGLAKKPPIVYVEHGRFYPDRRRLRRVLFNRLALRPCDRIIAVGEAVREALVVYEGLPAARIAVIYNGVKVEEFVKAQTMRQQVRGALGIQEHEVVFIHVARFDPLKDHATAVRGFAELSSAASRLILVGDGPTKPEVESLVKGLGLEKRLALLGFRTDIPELLAAADVFLLTSLSEGVPVTIIEAMAAGLPVIATAVGGVPELIGGGREGILVAPKDPKALARAMALLCQNPELRQHMGRAAQQKALRQFTEEKMHEQYIQIIEETLVASQLR